MGYAVLHIAKGTSGKAGGLGRHIDRTKNVPNADPELTPRNFRVGFDLANQRLHATRQQQPCTLQERIAARIKEGYKGKTAIRKDAVTHLNIVLTGSHEEMAALAKNPKNLTRWALANAQFIGARFGYRNIVEFTVHMDERTPHIHCVVVPLTQDGRLSAKEVMGNKSKLSMLQDEYGKAMQNFGLQRGIKGSTATHDSVREYYARVNDCLLMERIEPEIPCVPLSPPTIGTPPIFNREKWAESQNKAIWRHFAKMREELTAQARKCAQNALKQATTQNMRLTERNRRLVKDNAQLRGLIKSNEEPSKINRKAGMKRT